MQLAPTVEERLARIGWRPAVLPDDAPAGAEVARVIAQHRAGYELHDGDRAFNAQPAPRFLKAGVASAERPAVGDFVLVVGDTPAADKPPQIERVLPRRSELARAASGERHQRQIIATNVDTVFVICGLDGDFNPARIERYLLLVADSGARAVAVLTKADIAADAEPASAELRRRLPIDIEIMTVDAKSPASIAPMLKYLQVGDSAVLVGSSGAGKSTLTNTLLGDERQATAAVRRHDSRGRHTTTWRALVMLPSGGCLIDTPGMREIKLTGGEDLGEGQFADIEMLAAECRFGDCNHLSEPGCAVRAALADGRLDAARWQNYLKLRDELAAAADSLEAQLRRKGEARVLTKALDRRLSEKYGKR
ncbi:MAG TPA: ribosome small subunit-dependent GTPase A [Rhodanobacteraceae bacterium]|nr:ribosome small subunit-dependent GTPase A [Rhodanobacteraceae bacterium]